MKVVRVPKGSYYCVVCDAEAAVEVSHDGALKVFWACDSHDGEITLCECCALKLRDELNNIIKDS